MADVIKNCEWCKKYHSVREADLKRGWGRFCSKVCKAKEQEFRTGQNKAYHSGKVKRIASNLPAVTVKRQDMANGWTWRVKDGKEQLHPCNMVTRHLFFTLRMIWNHAMPAEARVGDNIQLYSFGPAYTEEYMRHAIAHIGTELLTRTDIQPAWQKQLDKMQAWLANPKRLAGKVEPKEKTKGNTTSRHRGPDLAEMLARKRIFMVMEDEMGNQYLEDAEDEGFDGDDYMYDGDGWGARDD